MRNLDNIIQRKFYRRIQRPGRYTGGELHSVKPNPGDFLLALAFPDLYEIGFPYLGFQILYHLLNRIEGVSCQRVYAPAEDAERILRQEGITLFTLEGKTPLKELDLLGFTLQYELHSSNILNMLELGGIPLHSQERDEEHPLVIAGGPLAYHPEAFADFFDAFVLGDGEESFPALVKAVKRLKAEGANRARILERISKLAGVYVPGLIPPHHLTEIQAEHIPKLDIEYYPPRPLVPSIAVEHNRLTVEIMRGCARGCRFCNAGMINRPTREISVDEVLKYIKESLQNSGYEEVSLLSLSTADYSDLPTLLRGLMEIVGGENLSLSYPSLRPDAFTPEMASAMSSGRKTGLTFAPEAGSERLRKIINKDLCDEDLFRALNIASQFGWKSVKLYFILGLPGETEKDIQAIVDLAHNCRKILKSSPNKPLHISLAVFSPKPNTSFQRAGMLDLNEIWNRINLIRRRLKNRCFKVSFHDPQMALVETLIARGDRRVGRVIEKVFRNGARFEGWSDRFNFQLWEDALKTEGLDWNCFTAEIGENVRLPWHHLKTGISQIFFHDEWRNSQNGIITPDCRTICSQCGLECAPPPNTKPLTLPLSPKITAELPKTIYRWRFKYSRKGAVSYISHLENVKLLERAFRRAGIPICYSRGFHPHPRFSFGFPLPLGYEARADYFDAYLSEKSANYSAKLNRVLPSGMKFISDREVSAEEPSLFQALNAISYEVRLLGEKPNETLIKDWLVSKEADIFRYILNLNYQKRIFTFTVRLVSGRHLRPENLLLAINYPTWQAKVIRLDCFTIQDLKT